MARMTRPGSFRRLLVRRALLTSVLAAGAWGCALVAGVDFGAARLDSLEDEQDAGTQSASGEEVPTASDAGCPPEQKACNGACVDKTDPAYGCGSDACSPCSLAHATGSTCGAGETCAPEACEPGYGDCDQDTKNGCEADLTRPETCGSCGTACDAGMLCAPSGCVVNCPAPLVPCNGACVDPKTSVAHCGACNNACPGAANADPVCSDGGCGVACRTGFADCANAPPKTCAALPKWYVDKDLDNYGTSAFVTACTKPAKHAAKSGDCLDTNAAVHPNAAGSTVPFAGPNGPSFDYDCSGTEVEVDAQAHFTGCSGACNELGYDPLPPRAGAGVNNYCGSPTKHACYVYYSCANVAFDSGARIQCK